MAGRDALESYLEKRICLLETAPHSTPGPPGAMAEVQVLY